MDAERSPEEEMLRVKRMLPLPPVRNFVDVIVNRAAETFVRKYLFWMGKIIISIGVTIPATMLGIFSIVAAVLSGRKIPQHETFLLNAVHNSTATDSEIASWAGNIVPLMFVFLCVSVIVFSLTIHIKRLSNTR